MGKKKIIRDLSNQIETYQKVHLQLEKCHAKDCSKYVYPDNNNVCHDCKAWYCDDHLEYINISYYGLNYCSRGYGCYI